MCRYKPDDVITMLCSEVSETESETESLSS